LTSANPRDNLSTDKHYLYSDSYWWRGTFMSETGRTYRLTFKGHPSEAAEVRAWTSKRSTHPDAPQVANELFVAILGSGADAIEMELSTAGDRLRITADGPQRLPLRHSHGPGWRIVAELSRTSGVTTDEHGLWAQLHKGQHHE
jgi:hypothetical protein